LSAALSGPASPLPRLAVVFGTYSFGPLILGQSIREVCEPVWLVDRDPARLGPAVRVLARFGPVLEGWDMTPSEMAAAVGAAGATGITTFDEACLETATVVGTALGFRVNPADAVSALTDKFVQREALRRAGLATPHYTLLPAGTPPGDVRRLTLGTDLPAVLKPTRGTGSRDTFRVDTVGDLVQAWTALLRRDEQESFLLETLIPGTERGTFGDQVSVESVVQDGQPLTFGVSGRFASEPPFRETGCIVPAPIGAGEAEAAVGVTNAALRAVGVRWAVTHTELKLGPDGPQIIEVNGRPAGNGIPPLWRKRHGQSLLARAAMLALPAYPSVAGEELPGVDAGDGPFGYQWDVLPPIGATRIRSLSGVDAVAALDGVDDVQLDRQTGDPVSWRTGSAGYLMLVRGHAPTRAELARVPDLVRSTIEVEYEMEEAGSSPG
jgi:hypothetical protein